MKDYLFKASGFNDIVNNNKQNNHVIGVIPARYHSTRFPGKPLALINGYPLVYHVYQRAVNSTLNDVIIATDDHRVAETCIKLNCKVMMTSTQHLSGTDRVAEVAARYKADAYINIQGDEPVIAPALINKLVKTLTDDQSIRMVTARKKITLLDEINNPNVVKVVVGLNDFALYFSRSPIPFKASHSNNNSPTHCFKHIGIYGYRRDTLLRLTSITASPLELIESLEQLRALENGIGIKVIETDYNSIGVDTVVDLKLVNELLAQEEK